MQKTVVGFGASSMAGSGDSTGGGFLKRLQPSFDQHQFINLGVGGDTTREMLQRCEQVAAYRPYDLIVLLGCNDLPRENDGAPQRRTNIEEYCQNLASILTTIKGQRNLFVTSFQVDPMRSGVSAETFDLYVGQGKKIAATSGYEILDLYSIIRESQCDYLCADGIHFNAQGHQIIASLVELALLGGEK